MPKLIHPPDCRRCGGKGGLIIRIGEPGQDWRTTKHADMKWQEPWSVRCPVCLGEGVEPKKPRRPILGKHTIVETDKDRKLFERETWYLINRWRLKGFEAEGLEKF